MPPFAPRLPAAVVPRAVFVPFAAALVFDDERAGVALLPDPFAPASLFEEAVAPEDADAFADAGFAFAVLTPDDAPPDALAVSFAAPRFGAGDFADAAFGPVAAFVFDVVSFAAEDLVADERFAGVLSPVDVAGVLLADAFAPDDLVEAVFAPDVVAAAFAREGLAPELAPLEDFADAGFDAAVVFFSEAFIVDALPADPEPLLVAAFEPALAAPVEDPAPPDAAAEVAAGFFAEDFAPDAAAFVAVGFEAVDFDAEDFAGVDLEAADLAGADLAGADLAAGLLDAAPLADALLDAEGVFAVDAFAADAPRALLVSPDEDFAAGVSPADDRAAAALDPSPAPDRFAVPEDFDFAMVAPDPFAVCPEAATNLKKRLCFPALVVSCRRRARLLSSKIEKNSVHETSLRPSSFGPKSNRRSAPARPFSAVSVTTDGRPPRASAQALMRSLSRVGSASLMRQFSS